MVPISSLYSDCTALLVDLDFAYCRYAVEAVYNISSMMSKHMSTINEML